MTPWERLNLELKRQHKSQVALAEVLGASKQSMTHWKSRGVPRKYLRACAEFLGRTVDWLEFGDDSIPPLPLAVQALAVYLARLQEADRKTALSLLTTLANDPGLADVVASGLLALADKPDSLKAP